MVELLLHNASLPKHLSQIASLPRGSGEGNSFRTLPQRRGAVGSGTPLIYCQTAQGAVGPLQYTATPHWAEGRGVHRCIATMQ